MSVLRRVKLRTPDGIESIEYPLGVDAENVEVANGENLSQRLARIDEDLENNEENIAAVGELAGTNKQNIGANEIRIDALERRSASVDKKPYYFNTVADMKADPELKAGDMAITLGYYEANDGGNGEYRIVSSSNSYYIENIVNNLKAELLIEKNEVNIKALGVHGTADFNETSKIQEIITNSYNKTLFFPYGTYVLSQSLIINNNINIIGSGNNGLSKLLGSGYTTFRYDQTSGVAIDFTCTSQNFREINIKNIRIIPNENNNSSYGLRIHNFNHFNIDNINVSDFRNGKGIVIGNGETFGSQYGLINNCRIGMCLIGIELNKSNGINIENCYIDGNNNGSDRSQYTHGYPDNSYGIYINAGDSSKIDNCRIQGLEVGIYIGSTSTYNTISNIRCEMCYSGIDIDGLNNTVLDGCSNNNYLLLGPNGLASDKLYGYFCRISNRGNTIGKANYGSCYGPRDLSDNLYNDMGEHFVVWLGDVTKTTTFTFPLSNYLKNHSGIIRSVRIKANNMADLKAAGYSNRWTFAVQSSYKESSSIADDQLNSFVVVGEKLIDALTSLKFYCTKNGSAPDISGLCLEVYMLPY